MSFTVDFLDDGRVLEWEATVDGAVATEHNDYTPRFYVAPQSPDDDIDLTRLRRIYENHPDVVTTEIVSQRPGFRRDGEEVLAVDVTHVDRVTPLVCLVKHGSYRSSPSEILPASTSTSRGSSATASKTISIQPQPVSCRHSGLASQ